MRSVNPVNSTLKLILTRVAPLWSGATECGSEEGKRRNAPDSTLTTTWSVFPVVSPVT
jgi:hypothetical protein